MRIPIPTQYPHDVLNHGGVVAYAIAVRSSEYDIPPELLDDFVSGHLKGVEDNKRSKARHLVEHDNCASSQTG